MRAEASAAPLQSQGEFTALGGAHSHRTPRCLGQKQICRPHNCHQEARGGLAARAQSVRNHVWWMRLLCRRFCCCQEAQAGLLQRLSSGLLPWAGSCAGASVKKHEKAPQRRSINPVPLQTLHRRQAWRLSAESSRRCMGQFAPCTGHVCGCACGVAQARLALLFPEKQGRLKAAGEA